MKDLKPPIKSAEGVRPLCRRVPLRMRPRELQLGSLGNTREPARQFKYALLTGSGDCRLAVNSSAL